MATRKRGSGKPARKIDRRKTQRRTGERRVTREESIPAPYLEIERSYGEGLWL